MLATFARVAPRFRAGSHRRKRLVLVGLMCFWAVIGATAASAAPAAATTACPGAETMPSAATLPSYADTTGCLVNELRGASGLAALVRNAALDRVSAAYSRRMVAEAFFAHVAPDGTNLVERLGDVHYFPAHSPWIVGENLAWATDQLSTPSTLIAEWMASPTHRANILYPGYREIGIGVVLGDPDDPATGVTVTTDFGAIGEVAPASRVVRTKRHAGCRRAAEHPAPRRGWATCATGRVHGRPGAKLPPPGPR
jgi:uncharacterized protein YkwD